MVRVKDLVPFLEGKDGEMVIEASDGLGSFFSVNGVEIQEWKDRDGMIHRALTIKLGKYDSTDSIISEGEPETYECECLCKDVTDGVCKSDIYDDICKTCPCFENPDDDKKFVENVEGIDKKEALEAKMYFDKDTEKDVISDAKDKYAKCAKQAWDELFGENTKNLESLTISDLLKLIYKNGWQNELDEDVCNSKMYMMSILYHKLEERINELYGIKEKKKDNNAAENNPLGFLTMGTCSFPKDFFDDIFGGFTFRN